MGGMARQRKSNEWRDEDKIGLAVLGIIVTASGIYGFIVGLRKLVHHPTLGNAAMATLDALNLAYE
jgi:hypothetical protein